MIDFLLGVLLAVTVYRGYRRGFVREISDLALLLFGALVAFRTGSASGVFFESWTGASPLVARLLGSFLVFFVIQFGGSLLLRRFLTLPLPARTVDRVGGAAVSGGWFVIGATMLLLVASAVPFSDGIQRQLDDSRAVQLVAGEGSAAKEAISSLVGDRVLEALVNLNQLIGERQVVIEGADTITIPTATGGLVESSADAREVFELLNLARIDAGADPLAWSGALAEVAAGHGREMYEQGYFSHVSPETGTVSDRVRAVGIPYAVVGENLALSPTAGSVHDGLMASPSHRENMLEQRFTRVGISAIEGPLGLMVVQVFTG